jgi:alpha-glucoside transport system substrate-binding protein
VNVVSAFTGDEAAAFQVEIDRFEEETGITVDYEPTADFEVLLPTRVEAGDPPDIALFPQTGLLTDLAAEADATPLDEFLDVEAVEDTMAAGFLESTRDDEGNTFGLPMRIANKSLIWYPAPEFEEAGYEPPETQEELIELEDQIRADGGVPWCLGMESGEATGWVGTDWVEDFVLRLHGADVYDDWVDGEVQFQSDEIREAFEEFERVWAQEGNVLGGTDGMLEISIDASPEDMFTDPPTCWMHRQGNFAVDFFPDDVQEELEERVGVAYFPGFEGEDEPVLAGGDFAMLLNDTSDAREFMEFLGRDDFGEEWAAQGGWLSPNVNFDTSAYVDDIHRDMHDTVIEADLVRFDASDDMPGVVGTGTFWDGIVNWVDGRESLDEVLESIDDSWPD